jgi:hypothetical protein
MSDKRQSLKQFTTKVRPELDPSIGSDGCSSNNTPWSIGQDASLDPEG